MSKVETKVWLICDSQLINNDLQHPMLKILKFVDWGY